jgi:hypothetical protein
VVSAKGASSSKDPQRLLPTCDAPTGEDPAASAQQRTSLRVSGKQRKCDVGRIQNLAGLVILFVHPHHLQALKGPGEAQSTSCPPPSAFFVPLDARLTSQLTAKAATPAGVVHSVVPGAVPCIVPGSGHCSPMHRLLSCQLLSCHMHCHCWALVLRCFLCFLCMKARGIRLEAS